MKAKKILALCAIFILSATCAFAYTNSQLQDMLELNNVSLNKAINKSSLAGLDVKDARASFQPTVDFLASGTYLVNTPMVENIIYNFNVGISQPIFTWGKLSSSVEIYDKVELVSNLQRQLLKKQLSGELKARESGFYYIKKMIVNLKKQAIVTSRLVEISDDSLENGILTKQDTLESQVKAKSVDVGLKQFNMELENQLAAIKILTGNPNLELDDIEFIVDEQKLISISQVDRRELVARALSPTRETFDILNLLEKVSSQTKYIAKNSLYWNPNIALQVELAYSCYTVPFLQKDCSFEDDFRINFSLAITDTLWDGGKAVNDVARKVIKENDAYLDSNEAREQITQKLYEALDQIDYSTSNIEFKELCERVSDEKINQNQSMMDEGYGDETDVLIAKLEKYGYELEALQERITRASSYYIVEYLIGE